MRLKLFILSLFVCFLAKAQQTPVFAEYNYNPFLLNSAYAGMLANAEINISNSGFFNQFDGSPRTLTGTFTSPLQDGKMGLGGGILFDEVGVTTTTQFYAAYSYKIELGFMDNRPYYQNYQTPVLSFGLTAGVMQYEDRFLELGLEDDPNFAQNLQSTVPMVGMSLLYNQERFYAGISTPNILGDVLASDKSVSLSLPVYGIFGYRFYAGLFDEYIIKPNLLLKYEPNAPFQLDVNVATTIKEKFELGAGYRSNSSVNLLAGAYLFENFRLMYFYNHSFGTNPFSSRHGIQLSLKLGDGYSTN